MTKSVQRSVMVMLFIIAAAAVSRDIRKCMIHCVDVRLGALEELVLGKLLKSGMACHGQVWAIKLNRRPRSC